MDWKKLKILVILINYLNKYKKIYLVFIVKQKNIWYQIISVMTSNDSYYLILNFFFCFTIKNQNIF